MSNRINRIEKLEREAGAQEPVRVYCAELGDIVPPGCVVVTFKIDHPDRDGELPEEPEHSSSGERP